MKQTGLTSAYSPHFLKAGLQNRRRKRRESKERKRGGKRRKRICISELRVIGRGGQE